MKTYKIYVNGMYVGTEDFTKSEVTAIESDQDIKLIEKQKAETLFGASQQDGNLLADDGKPNK